MAQLARPGDRLCGLHNTRPPLARADSRLAGNVNRHQAAVSADNRQPRPLAAGGVTAADTAAMAQPARKSAGVTSGVGQGDLDTTVDSASTILGAVLGLCPERATSGTQHESNTQGCH